MLLQGEEYGGRGGGAASDAERDGAVSAVGRAAGQGGAAIRGHYYHTMINSSRTFTSRSYLN